MRDVQGARSVAHDRREHVLLRRSRHAVRYHDQRLAYLREYGADQRVESLLGVHAPGQFGVQSGVAQFVKVLARGRRVRHGGVSPRRRHRDLGAGYPHR